MAVVHGWQYLNTTAAFEMKIRLANLPCHTNALLLTVLKEQKGDSNLATPPEINKGTLG